MQTCKVVSSCVLRNKYRGELKKRFKCVLIKNAILRGVLHWNKQNIQIHIACYYFFIPLKNTFVAILPWWQDDQESTRLLEIPFFNENYIIPNFR